MPRNSPPIDTDNVLRAADLRVTAVRSTLLELLVQEPKPRTVEFFAKRLAGSFDTVTVYRTLATFSEAGIVTRSSLGHDHAHYELAIGRAPHHHAICRSCGRIEDVPEAASKSFPSVPGFACIDARSVELYGTCVPCST